MKENLIEKKSFSFALKIIALFKEMQDQREYILSKQLLRSGTSIGANVREAIAGESKNDFIHKMSIASKEARETDYWLELIQKSNLVKLDVSDLQKDAKEIIRIITSIVKTSKER